MCMGCYLKAGAEEGETYLPGSSISLISTDSVEYAKQQTAMMKRALND
jgi:hypothetical protein